MHIDVHQHIWTEPLIEALAARRELPFVRSEHGLTVLRFTSPPPTSTASVTQAQTPLSPCTSTPRRWTAWAGAYVIGRDGVLARHSVSSGEELRPLTVAH